VQEVISSCGYYVKFKVRGASGTECDTQPTGLARNAFAVLMQSQRDLSLPAFPNRIPARTKKDDLYNAGIDLLEQMNLALPHNKAGSEGSGGSRNLERGVQPLAHEAHSRIFGLPRPLPVR